MKSRHLYAVHAIALLVLVGAIYTTVRAENTPPGGSTVRPTRAISLADYLISRLRATTEDQKSYLREVCKQVDQGRLEKRLVLALERYARRKNPSFAFPVFERALRVEAGKRGVPLPTIKEIVARNGANAARAASDSRIR
jgi:hypothetical protein